ncbi:MAG: rRNA maturation RNase YbeY [Verrucomicrobiales bacterium]|nr:rRNA maturation RNase YbeY [Verrucomicrobiales bacterium]
MRPGTGTGTVRVQNRHPSRRLDAALLRRLARAALAEPPIADHATWGYEVGIVITGSREMARINQDHLGHEGPTDVITFDYTDEAGAETPGRPGEALGTNPPAEGHGGGSRRGRRLAGEILICLDVAGTQAAAYGTTWALEVLRYLVHGLLHLSGFDDLAPAARAVMKRHENRLVRRLKTGLDPAGLERPTGR